MKQKLIFVIFQIFMCAVLSQAQTADQIIAQNIKARGGYKKLKAIKTY